MTVKSECAIILYTLHYALSLTDILVLCLLLIQCFQVLCFYYYYVFIVLELLSVNPIAHQLVQMARNPPLSVRAICTSSFSVHMLRILPPFKSIGGVCLELMSLAEPSRGFPKKPERQPSLPGPLDFNTIITIILL